MVSTRKKMEIGSGEAANLLGVTRQAIKKMRDRKVLKGRPIRVPGSAYPDYAYSIEDVIELRRKRALDATLRLAKRANERHE